MKRISILSLLVAALLFAAIPTAAAQSNTTGTEAAGSIGGSLSTSTTTTASIAVPVGIILTIVWLVSDDDESASLHQYMDHNAVALQHDLYLGGGESAQDLAVFFGVEEDEMAEFGDILYDKRRDLAPLADPTGIEDGSAYQFARIIVTEMQARGWSMAS